jgi:hypothetical protein
MLRFPYQLLPTGYFSTLKTEAIRSSETLVDSYRTAWPHSTFLMLLKMAYVSSWERNLFEYLTTTARSGWQQNPKLQRCWYGICALSWASFIHLESGQPCLSSSSQELWSGLHIIEVHIQYSGARSETWGAPVKLLDPYMHQHAPNNVRTASYVFISPLNMLQVQMFGNGSNISKCDSSGN